MRKLAKKKYLMKASILFESLSYLSLVAPAWLLYLFVNWQLPNL